MSYTFKTNLLGPIAEIEGVFYEGEKETIDSPSVAPSFEIELITINSEYFEIDVLSIDTISDIQDEAFEDAHNSHDPY